MDTRMKWRLALMPFALGALAVPIAGGCDSVSDAQSALCCTEFKVGGAITADIGGGAESLVAVQAVADFAGIAAASIDDLTKASGTSRRTSTRRRTARTRPRRPRTRRRR